MKMLKISVTVEHILTYTKFQMMVLNMFSFNFKVSDDDAAAVQSNNTQGKKGIVLSTHSNKVALIDEIVT